MTEQIAPNQNDIADKSLQFMETTIEEFMSAASVEAVYGKPVKQGDTLIIPAAEVVAGMGFGVGGGGGGAPENGGSGVGGGGGGRVLSRPVAVVIASPDGVRVEPVVDVTKVALALFTALGFMVGMVARMRNPKRALAEYQE